MMKRLLPLLFMLCLALPAFGAIKGNPHTTNDWVKPSLFSYHTRLVFAGDSETAGKSDIGLTKPWPWWLTNVYLSTTNIAFVTNTAVVAQYSLQTWTNYTNAMQPWASNPASNNTNSVLSVWAGINDSHDGTNAAFTFQNLSNIWYAAKRDGFEVVAFTIPPLSTYTGDYYEEWGDPDFEVAHLNTNRTALNALIRGQRGVLYDYLVDVEKILGEIGGNTTNANHTIEGIHFNHDGQRMIAEEWVAVYKAGKLTTNYGTLSVATITAENVTGDGSGLTNVTGRTYGLSLTITNTAETSIWVATNGNDGTGARGDASLPFLTLSNALVASQAGDAIFLGPGHFYAGSSGASNELRMKPNQKLIGQGPNQTHIDSDTYPHDPYKAVIIQPTNNCIIADLSVNGTNHAGGTQFPVGINAYGQTPGAVSNVVLVRVWTTGFSDGLYVDGSSPVAIDGYDCYFNSFWDTVFMRGHNNHKIRLYNCYLNAHGPSPDGTWGRQVRGVYMNGGMLEIYGGLIVASNGPAITGGIVTFNSWDYDFEEGFIGYNKIDLYGTHIVAGSTVENAWNAGSYVGGIIATNGNEAVTPRTNSLVTLHDAIIESTNNVGAITNASTAIASGLTMRDAAYFKLWNKTQFAEPKLTYSTPTWSLGSNQIAELNNPFWLVPWFWMTNSVVFTNAYNRVANGLVSRTVYEFAPTNSDFNLYVPAAWKTADGLAYWTVTNGTIVQLEIEATGTNHIKATRKVYLP